MQKLKLYLALVLILSCAAPAAAQQKKRSERSGYFSITQRTSMSMWGLNEWALTGLGKGTAFRIQFSDRLNSEWYGDFIKTQYKGKAFRSDRHLTNSIMFYLRKPDTSNYKFQPFISASMFCLDFTHVESIYPGGESLERFSFSQQFGIGSHFFLTERADISIYAQYYNHLGNDIHIDEHPDGSIHIREQKGRISLEGHVFLVFSAGYRIGDIWGKKKE